MTTDSSAIGEIRDRVTRIESRIVKLGEHMGADLRTNARVFITQRPDACALANIDSLDVSISRIMQELQRLNIAPKGVQITHHGRIVATFE